MTKDQGQFRHECEARYVLSHYRDKERRQRYYKAIALRRGKEAANQLITEVKRQNAMQREQRWKKDKQLQQNTLEQCKEMLK